MSEFIKNIKITNFKSIKDQTIDDCRRINLFLGYPNVGKSNILEAIGMFSLYNPAKSDEEEYSFPRSIRNAQNLSEVEKLNDLCRVRKNYELFFNQSTKDVIKITLSDEVDFFLSERDSELIGRIFLNPEQSAKQFNRTRVPLLSIIIDNIFNVKAEKEEYRLSRHYIPNYYVKKYDFKETVSINKRTGSSLSVPYGDNLLDVLQRNPDLRKDLADLFKEYNLRFAIENATQSIKLIKEMEEDSIVIIPYYQIADTLRRLVFYKTAIATNLGSVLLFEEPEAHMFPPYISKLTSDVKYFDKNQYFISTHSPYVLNDFVENAGDEVAVYIVGLKNGETIIRRLKDEEMVEVNQYGIDLFFNLESYLVNG